MTTHAKTLEALRSLYNCVIEQNRRGASWHEVGRLMAALAQARVVLAEATPVAAAPDEREAFEAWAEREGFNIHRDDSDKYRDYHRATTRWAWQAWQARAAAPAIPGQVVEAPKTIYDRRTRVDEWARQLEASMEPTAAGGQVGQRLSEQLRQFMADDEEMSTDDYGIVSRAAEIIELCEATTNKDKT